MDNYAKDTALLDQVYSLKRLRESYEPTFYLARKAYEGKHFTYWNRTTQRLTEVPIRKSVFNQLPEIAKQADAFTNFLLSSDFTFTVVPRRLGDTVAMEESQALSLLAYDYYNKLKANSIFADYIHYAIMDNVSFLEVSPNDQKRDVDIRTFDAFDILFNPLIKDWSKQTLVVKVVKRRVKDLRNSKLYKIPTDYTGGGSGFFSWKDVYEREKYTSFTDLHDDEVLLFECYIVDPVNGLRIKTVDGSGTILRNDLYANIKRVPLIPLRIFSGEWYQPSYVYRLIPINRSMDLMMSRMEDLMLRLSKGGWIFQEEENINGGMDEDIGQIIRYASTKPDQIEMPQVPNFLMQLFTSMMSLSERYGFSSVNTGDLGGQGSGLRTTGMLEQLTGLTQKNNSAPINNLRMAVAQILELTFMFLYEMWDTPNDAITMNPFEETPKFVSQKFAPLYAEDKNIVAIPADFKRFDVEVDDGMGYTLQQRKDTALALHKLGVIGDATLKKIFKLGSSSYLLQAEEATMADSPEFQLLLKAFPQMTPEQKQSFITMLKTVSQLKGEPIPEGMPGAGGQPTGGAPTPPVVPGGAPPVNQNAGAPLVGNQNLAPKNVIINQAPPPIPGGGQ